MAVADSRDSGPAVCAGPELRTFFTGGLAALERCAAAVDALNVFPVPDADTGTNLLITLRHGVEAARECQRSEAGVVARVLADGALRGARGNSGAIFAQLCAGFAASLDGTPAVEARRWAEAWQAGATAAWQSVASPVEGTILTVAHATARAAATAARTDGDLRAVWASMADAADAAVDDTPRLLPVLERARVVDAGALGLALFLRGSLHAFTGAPLPDPARLGRPSVATRHVIEEAGFSRFCTQFTLAAADADRTGLVAAFTRCGESVDIVTMNQRDTAAGGVVHVHLHTDLPDQALALANTLGVVSDVRIDDMEQQRARYAAQVEAALEIGLVPIVLGAGMRRLFESLLGVTTVIDSHDGRLTPERLAAMLRRLPQQPLIVLPNDARLVDRATAATAMCDRSAGVVPTTNMPEGVAAALAFNPVASLERNVAAMTAAARAMETIEIRYRGARETVHPEHANDTGAVAKSAIEVRCGEDLAAAADAGAAAWAADWGASVAMITVYYGADVTRAQADALVSRLRRHFPDVDIEVVDGGQQDCPIWIAFDRHADANRY